MNFKGLLTLAMTLFVTIACQKSQDELMAGTFKHDPATPNIIGIESPYFNFDGSGHVHFAGKVGDCEVSADGTYKVQNEKVSVHFGVNQIQEFANATWSFARSGRRITIEWPGQEAAFEKSN